MRIELDANGYVLNIFWGCMTGECIEYKGKIPAGYSSLYQWANEAEIKAYYLDINGNLVLDYARQLALEELYAVQERDNKPVLWKNLSEALEPLIGNYTEMTAIGGCVITTDARSIVNYMPKVKLTRINPYPFTKIDLFIQGKQMLRNDAVTETINGIKFTKSDDGGIAIKGKATADVSYNLSGGEENDIPIFGLKKGLEYCLNIGGFDCELKCFNGYTTEQVYVGSSGIISLTLNKNVTQVLLKIPSGTTVDKKIYPMLEYGTQSSDYEEYYCRYLCIDISEFVGMELFPNENLYPSNTLLLPETGTYIDYIRIDGTVILSSKGVAHNLGTGSVNLFNGYNFVYTTQTSQVELTYKTNVMEGTFKGDILDSNNLKILESEGLISSLQFISSGRLYSDTTGLVDENASPYGRLGFTGSGQNTYDKNLFIHATIPNNFIVTNAKVLLFYSPVRVPIGSVNAWSRTKNVKLYNQSVKDWNYYYYENPITYDTIESVRYNAILAEIEGAFGNDGWTSSVATDSDHAEQQVTSIDIAEFLKPGSQTLVIKSDYAPDTSSEDLRLECAKLTGAAIAILKVTGYTNYSQEV